jgi:hypothetical protein
MAQAARLAGIGNLAQPAQQLGQFILGGARLITELVEITNRIHKSSKSHVPCTLAGGRLQVRGPALLGQRY